MSRHVLHTIKRRPAVGAALVTALLLTLCGILSLQASGADTPIAASAESIHPLGTGDAAPRFAVRDVNGDRYDFNPRELDRPVMLITFRGGWCPYCNLHLSELRTVMPELNRLGVDVLFLSGDRPELLYDSLQRDTQDDISGLDYTILSDADAEAGIALGIAFRAAEQTIRRRQEKGQDIADSSMLRHGVLSVPAVYMIDTDGQIVFSFVEADYKVRLPAEDMLAVARAAVQ